MRVAYKFHISSVSPQDPLLFIGLYISLCLLPLSPTHCWGHTQHIALHKESFSHYADMQTKKRHTMYIPLQRNTDMQTVENQ